MEQLKKQADVAADFLKGMANKDRLLILCKIFEGEKSVGEIVTLTKIPQTSVSQHLSKLKKEGIVTFRRDHRTLYYSINHETARSIMQVLHKSLCDDLAA